jgi:DNA modification methylase
MQDLVVYHENKPVKFFQLMSHGLVVNGSPSITEWLQAGKALKKAQGAVQWWIGDWLNYGERAYGEKYTQALEEMDYVYGSLANLKYVANRIEISSRDENLSWKHHNAVAPLPLDEQCQWLQRALQGNDGKPWSVATLRAAIKDSKSNEPSWIKRTDVWNIPSCDDRYGTDYPGRIPGQIVLNVLYYFTDKGDLVIDPMAGGGVTIDACRELGRRCMAFDIMSSREDIIHADATLSWPLDELADLVFIDPPYWSQMASDYGGMASKPYDEYLADMQAVFTNAHDVLRNDGVLAALIAPVAIQDDYTDIPFDFVAICKRIGFKLIRRISVPVSSQQVGPQVIQHCRDNDIMVALIRDLLIFEK